MISRLSIAAALFAVIASSSLAFAASVQSPREQAAPAVKMVQLERVVITGKRIAP